MSHSEEILLRVKCTGSNKISGTFEEREKATKKTMCRSYMPLQQVGMIRPNLTHC